jgi:uncharacterized coiled-coil DUF342 family protein
LFILFFFHNFPFDSSEYLKRITDKKSCIGGPISQNEYAMNIDITELQKGVYRLEDGRAPPLMGTDALDDDEWGPEHDDRLAEVHTYYDSDGADHDMGQLPADASRAAKGHVPALDLTHTASQSPRSANGACSPRRNILLSSARLQPETERLMFEVREKIYSQFPDFKPSLQEKQKTDRLISSALQSFLEAVFQTVGLTEMNQTGQGQNGLQSPSQLHSSRHSQQTTSNIEHPLQSARVQEYVNSYKSRVSEVNDRLRRNDMQLDYLRGQLSRREHQLKQQRAAYLRELISLREQLAQACKLGDKHRPDFMTFYDWNASIDDDSSARGSGGNSEQAIAAVKEKAEKELNALKLKFKQEMDSLLQTVGELQKKIEENEQKWKKQMTETVDRYEKTLGELRNQHMEEIRELKEEHAIAMEEMQLRHEEQVRVLRDEYEEQINQLRTQVNELEETIRAKEQEMEEMKANFEAQMANVRAEYEQKIQTLTLEFEQKITELEFQLKESKNASANAQVRIERIGKAREDVHSRLLQLKGKQQFLLDQVASLTKECADLKKQLAANDEKMRQMQEEGVRGGLASVEQVQKLDEIKDMMAKDEQLQQEIADTNWSIVKARTKIMLHEKESAKEDPLARLDVFTRLKERYAMLVEKQQRLKEGLVRERTKNLERVLSSVRLLVGNNSFSARRVWRMPSLNLYSQRSGPMAPSKPTFIDSTVSPSPRSSTKKSKRAERTAPETTGPYYAHRNFSAQKQAKEQQMATFRIVTDDNSANSDGLAMRETPRPPSITAVKRSSVSDLMRVPNSPRRGVDPLNGEMHGDASGAMFGDELIEEDDNAGSRFRRGRYSAAGSVSSVTMSLDHPRGLSASGSRALPAVTRPQAFRPPSTPTSLGSGLELSPRGPSAMSSLSDNGVSSDRRQAVLDLLYRGRLSLGRPGSAGGGPHTAR